jgi:hypothetical protein
MIRVYRDTTTRRLETEARQLGYDLQIRVVEPDEDGRYFVTAVGGTLLKFPVSLGWTDAHAIESLKRAVWKHALAPY